ARSEARGAFDGAALCRRPRRALSPAVSRPRDRPSARRAVRHPAAADAAVPARVLREILLVVVLRVVERLLAADLRRDPPEAARGELALVAVAAAHRFVAPRIVADVDRRAILRADVVALPHPLRRVVRFPEHLEQRPERH